MKNIPLLIFLFTVVLITTISCKKEIVETYPEPKKLVMTINFIDNYINPKLGAIVFASDSLGSVIADTLIKGNGKFYIFAKPGIKVPNRFMLTIATWEPSMHNFEIAMKTYTQVKSSEWTLRGHRPDTLGHFTVNLTNVPQSALIIYANAGYSNLTTIYNDVFNLSYVDPDELLVKIEDGLDQKYQWINNIHPGENYNIDMASAQTPALSKISLSGKYYEARIWGFKDTDYENSMPIMTNYSLGNVPVNNEINVAVLPEHFQGYRTEMKLIENWTSGTSYTCRVNGDIPSSFQKIDASVQSLTDYPAGKVAIQSTGDFTTTNATWQFYGHNNQFFTWSMIGNNTITEFQLPSLSPSMLQTFPTLSLDSLYFYNAELFKYPGISSYDAFVNLVFDPANPLAQNKLNASSLIFGQGK